MSPLHPAHSAAAGTPPPTPRSSPFSAAGPFSVYGPTLSRLSRVCYSLCPSFCRVVGGCGTMPTSGPVDIYFLSRLLATTSCLSDELRQQAFESRQPDQHPRHGCAAAKPGVSSVCVACDMLHDIFISVPPAIGGRFFWLGFNKLLPNSQGCPSPTSPAS